MSVALSSMKPAEIPVSLLENVDFGVIVVGQSGNVIFQNHYITENFQAAGQINNSKDLEKFGISFDETADNEKQYITLNDKDYQIITGHSCDQRDGTVVCFYEDKSVQLERNQWELQEKYTETLSAVQTQKKRLNKLNKQITIEKNKISSILDHLPIGLVTINQEMGFDLIASKETEAILEEREFLEKEVPAFIKKFENMTDENRDIINTTIESSFGESLIQFAVNSHLLPQKISIKTKSGTKIVQMNWGTCLDDEENIERVLLCITDITQLVKLEQKTKEQEQQIRILTAIANEPYEKIRALTDKAKESCAQLSDSGLSDLRKDLAILHTLKGNFRVFNFSEVSNTIHQTEEVLQKFQKEGEKESLAANTSEHLSQTIEYIKSFVIKLEDNMAAFAQKSKTEDRNASESLRMHFSALLEKITLNPDLKKQIMQSEAGTHLKDLKNEILPDLNTIIGQYKKTMADLSRQLGKGEVKFIVSMEIDVRFCSKMSDHLFDILGHIFRNCVDHGLYESNKSSENEPKIFVTLSASGKKNIAFKIHDNGRGLNISALKKKILASGHKLTNPDDVREIARSIFNPSLSTKEEVTVISGRGVGMNAVQDSVEQAGGKADIILESAVNKDGYASFSLLLTYPDSCCIVDF